MLALSTTTDRRAVTLIETIVACAVFGLLTAMIAMILMQSRRAEQKLDLTTDANQMALVLIEKLKAEVRGSRIISTSPDGRRLRYWVSKRSGNDLVLTPGGQPDWEPGFPATPALAEIYLDKQSIWRDFQGYTQRLGAAGKDGDVLFGYNPANHTLRIQLAVGDLDPVDRVKQNLIRLDYTTYLTNQ